MSESRFVLSVSRRPDSADGPVSWRLLSANNRLLAKSPAGFATFAESRAAVLALCAALPRTTATAMTVPTTGRWVWSLRADGAVVAVSGRSYERERECVESLRRALAAAASAPLAPADRDVVVELPTQPAPARTPHDLETTR
ncbi:hypothetical protein [Motilibacter deserti]|uniref:DUF1508 domain-containing protein n=1 Tax=Motilibacter deserti TaxID=2714956 RepID=A0ABX0GZ73_9ACTN|nr:hypothetical protein [Motilibacter deserti]NHC14852.1 hypothetical protein [Motilibacter deserti]